MAESRDHKKLPRLQRLRCTESAITEILAEQVEMYGLTNAEIVFVLNKINTFWIENQAGVSAKRRKK